MRALLEDGRQYASLLKHFFAGFFENDWISRQQDMGATLAQIMGLVAAPGMFIPLLLYPYYMMFEVTPPLRRDPNLWMHMCMFIGFSMLVVGVATIVQWDSLFPDSRDYRILTPLPVRLRTMFAAKFSALVLFLLTFALTANTPASVMFPLAARIREATPLRYIGAQAAALFGAAAFTFCALVTLHGLVLNLLSYRWFRRVSAVLQTLSLVGILLGFFVFPKMSLMLDPHRVTVEPALYYYPPVWFVGLERKILGQAGPATDVLAGLALAGLAITAAGCLVMYALSYWRHFRRSLEGTAGLTQGPGLIRRAMERAADRIMLRHPLERASFHFILQTIARSRRHRLVLAAYAGVGVALALDSLGVLVMGLGRLDQGRPTPALLSIQLVLSFFFLCGVRYVYTIPVELNANWAFQLAESTEGRRHIRAAKKALVLLGGVLPAAVLFPGHAFLWGVKAASLHALYGVALAAVLCEVVFVRFSKIPFTCSYLPGKANVKLMGVVYVTAFVTYGYSMASIESRLLSNPKSILIFCGVALALVGAWNWIEAWRDRARGRPLEFLFQDEPDPAVRTLGLMS